MVSRTGVGSKSATLTNSKSIFANGVTIMDGSMGNQLFLEGLPRDALHQQIWSASALVNSKFHDAIIRIHKRHIEKGARWITTNSYGVQPTYYRRAFAPETWEEKMINDAKLAASLAVRAREESGKPMVQVLGSLPTICETHRPDLFQKLVEDEGMEFCIESYRKLAKALAAGGCDIFLLETINCWEEASCGLQGIARLTEPARSLPVVVSLEGAIRGLDLKPRPWRASEEVRKVIDISEKYGINICGLGFNCVPPEEILASLQSVALDSQLTQRLTSAGIKICAYANLNDRKKLHDSGFDIMDLKPGKIRKRADLVRTEVRSALLTYKGYEARVGSCSSLTTTVTSDRPKVTFKFESYAGYVEFARKFVDCGAEVIGGCCGCGPGGVRQIAEAFSSDTEHDTRPIFYSSI